MMTCHARVQVVYKGKARAQRRAVSEERKGKGEGEGVAEQLAIVHSFTPFACVSVGSSCARLSACREGCLAIDHSRIGRKNGACIRGAENASGSQFW